MGFEAQGSGREQGCVVGGFVDPGKDFGFILREMKSPSDSEVRKLKASGKAFDLVLFNRTAGLKRDGGCGSRGTLHNFISILL